MWEKPDGFDEQATAAIGHRETQAFEPGALEEERPKETWTEYFDEMAQASYYYNWDSGEAVWEEPDGYQEQLAAIEAFEARQEQTATAAAKQEVWYEWHE